jgi:hypothetical protein
MKSRYLLFASVAWLLLIASPDRADAQLPDCDCYFIFDCPAEKPICAYSVIGGGPDGPDNPDRACEWRGPKPTDGPGSGCDQPYGGEPGGPCDGICVEEAPEPVSNQWDHFDGHPGSNYGGSGCLAGGPYPYSIKFVVENEACNLPSHCSLCEAEVLIPSDTLAAGTAALVEATLNAECRSVGFNFDVLGNMVQAEIAGQRFDVCVNGVKVASAVSPPGQALVCQDGANPTSFQVAGDFPPGPDSRLNRILGYRTLRKPS